MGKQVIVRLFVLCVVASLAVSFAPAQTAPGRYTLILQDTAPLEHFASKDSVRSTEAVEYGRRIEAKQNALRKELISRKIQVTGAVSTVLNAVFVVAPEGRVSELKSLPGVKGVVPMRRYHMELNRATALLNAPAAWNALGAVQDAGRGVKIAILDSGIDQTHPAFQDGSLPVPGGYPICEGSDCAFTSNKVIVARSYVHQLAAGSMQNPAADSRPDDYSPRDHDGHGTAVASCAAGNWTAGSTTLWGMAPKAYLGNYKIYGSPGLNDGATDDVIIQALEDAFKDGMDVVSFASGSPAFTGPLDSGAVCGNDSGVPCDLVAQAFENVASKGVVIVAAAGNEGMDGVNANAPTFGSISSPADAPSVIAAGAITNSHAFAEVVTVPGSDVPAGLKRIPTQSGDANVPTGAITGTVRDVVELGNDGFACSPLPGGSLVGSVGLIERGNCTFDVKMSNTVEAGAIGVIFYMAEDSAPIAPGGLASFLTPSVMVSHVDGLALKSFAATNPGHSITIDPAGIEESAQADQVAAFSSVGPTTGDAALKPDLLAVGTNLEMAGETSDPTGALFTSNQVVVANGTSFATPLIAGAAALVKQRHPEFTPDQIKSALMSTANGSVLTDEGLNPVDARWTGAGKVDAGAAMATGIVVTPGSVSFGTIRPNSVPQSREIRISNTGSQAVILNVSIAPANTTSGAGLALDRQSLSLQPEASGIVRVSLSGAFSSAGALPAISLYKAPVAYSGFPISTLFPAAILPTSSL
jgi:subtilisin family serine protease